MSEYTDKAWAVTLENIRATSARDAARASKGCPGANVSRVLCVADGFKKVVACDHCGREFKARVKYSDQNDPSAFVPYHHAPA